MGWKGDIIKTAIIIAFVVAFFALPTNAGYAHIPESSTTKEIGAFAGEVAKYWVDVFFEALKVFK